MQQKMQIALVFMARNLTASPGKSKRFAAGG
jgi:hypothetical protein